MADGPMIVQGDMTVLLEVDNRLYPEARDALAGFAELVKSPEHVHTYRITPLSIWNARASGITVEGILRDLCGLSRFPVQKHVLDEITEIASRYGKLRLEAAGDRLLLRSDEPELLNLIDGFDDVNRLLSIRVEEGFQVDADMRGELKKALLDVGYPVEDTAGYAAGDPLEISLLETSRSGGEFGLRHYQQDAVDAFHASGGPLGGSGVIVQPCGAGKTIVGIGCMEKLKASTLVLVTNTTALRQWRDELLDKTSLKEEDIGEYSSFVKNIRPVTVTTYSMMTYRRKGDEGFPHMKLFRERDWGLIIYDEVHLLPAPVFRMTAGLQAKRRLGLTATLIREDGKEGDVFALIGPRKATVPWKELEREGWIARALCTEIRLKMSPELTMEHAHAHARARFRLAAENPAKLSVVRSLLERHRGERILIMGMYVDQVRYLGRELGIPVIDGSTPQLEREELFNNFRSGDVSVLSVSKVANFSVDLPDASVAIQVSGTFGSRQEEAQRLGRILRPKPGSNQAHFYTIVSRHSREEEFSMKRQLYLCEQGYEYGIEYVDETL
ncbi:MAG: helicase [Candidatus Aegiribacteria sp.]|nr:helicase [Candidatus Aegiribacteria sp.]MBD3295243.1 helicase [Candidatus Fermentibacteria bacterium]